MKDKSPVLTSSWRTHLLIIFLLLLLASIHMVSLIPHLYTHIPGDVMDTAEYPLNEWWTSHALLDLKINPFNNDYMFYPLGVNLVEHTYTFLDGLFYSLLRPFVSLIVFHNLLIWMTYFVNAVAAYVLFFYLTRTPWLAFLGALAFGHCPTLISYYKTAALLEVYDLVFFIYFSYRLAREPGLKQALAAGLFWGLTLYNYPYYFVFGGLWLFILFSFQLWPWTISDKSDSKISFWTHLFFWFVLPVSLTISILAPRRWWEFLIRMHLINWITFIALGVILFSIWGVFKLRFLKKTFPPPSPFPLEGEEKVWVCKNKNIFPLRWNPPSFKQVYIILLFFGITLGMAALTGFPYFQAYLKEESTRLAVSSLAADFINYSVDWVSFFAPFHSWLQGLYKIMGLNWLSGRPIVGTPAFLGFGFLFILLLGIKQFFRRPDLRLWFVSWGVFLILCLGPYLKIHGLIFASLPLPAYLIRFIPVLESARTLSRYLVPTMLFSCLLVVLILKPYFLKLGPWGKKGVYLGLFLMIGFEYGLIPYPYSFPLSNYQVPEVYKVIGEKMGTRSGILLDLPLFTHSGSRSAGHGETKRFYYQTAHHQKLLGGVSSKLDESVFVYFQNQPSILKLWSIQPVEEDELAALIYAYHIETMVLDKRYYPLEILKNYRMVFDSAPYIKEFYEDPRFLGLTIDQQSEVLKEKALEYWKKPDVLFGLIYPNFSRPLEVNQTPPIEMIIPAKLWNHLEIEFSSETVRSFSGLELHFMVNTNEKVIEIPFPAGPPGVEQTAFKIRLKDISPLDSDKLPAVRLTINPGRKRIKRTFEVFPFQASLLSLGQATGFQQTPSQALINDKHFFVDQRGITAFRISGQGKLLEKAHFDTHASVQETLPLTGWLKNFSEQEYLGLLVHDEASRSFSSEATEILRTFGARNPLAKENWQHSYVLLGKKGLPQGKAWEAHTVSSPAFIHSRVNLSKSPIFILLIPDFFHGGLIFPLIL